MNTKIEYLYRDGSNYKKWQTVIVSGALTKEQVKTILDCRNEELYFIPSQVGLPESRFDDSPTDDDHAWFELYDWSFEETDLEPTPGLPLTAEDLAKRFSAAKGNWKDGEWAC